ncbi:uncharacterized protein CDAR_575641 [Caerostris darwini]|uniref:Granulins domain-containing protein n=1 Tax=Caerostris darwini TaxID=1538125 RepID=A0AAV4S4T0_9ARAC|nr:uncharacterized protein CDAR_575641 [Caerostris darwini]
MSTLKDMPDLTQPENTMMGQKLKEMGVEICPDKIHLCPATADCCEKENGKWDCCPKTTANAPNQIFLEGIDNEKLESKFDKGSRTLSYAVCHGDKHDKSVKKNSLPLCCRRKGLEYKPISYRLVITLAEYARKVVIPWLNLITLNLLYVHCFSSK